MDFKYKIADVAKEFGVPAKKGRSRPYARRDRRELQDRQHV